jgi:predicted O-methyltransferase YrrM
MGLVHVDAAQQQRDEILEMLLLLLAAGAGATADDLGTDGVCYDASTALE